MLVIFIFPLNTNTIQLINTINPMIAKNSIIFKYTFEKPTIGSKANNKRKTINPILIHEYLQSILLVLCFIISILPIVCTIEACCKSTLDLIKSFQLLPHYTYKV